jgi:hypothetical protein
VPPHISPDPSRQFQNAVARCRMALAKYRVKQAIDKVKRHLGTTGRRNADPRLTPIRPRDPLTN